MTNLITDLNWRYATKMFDKTKKVSETDLAEIVEAFRLTSSSFGMQPWKMILVENEEFKNSLVEHSFGQSQISDCSHLLVLCRVANIDDNYISKYLEKIAETRCIPVENLEGLQHTIKGFLARHTEEQVKKWASEQVYIALGGLLSFLASAHIDSCTIGGFNPAKYDEILGLGEMGLASVVVLPIGYRSQDDKYASLAKVRFEKEDVFMKI
ncbi:MAG: NAD(P)H-dependent oxidoreductase [Candidatus Gracilibacteria bacterium]|nr:NAD(P)H-dependent oxidoreductase [Candidatus Gracilibacteria bacterium]